MLNTPKASKQLFKPLSPKRNFEEVARQIKDLIIRGELTPTELLPSERDMAAAFNASRNTIREAYRILEENGFIELKTGSSGGARVCRLDGRKVTQSLSDLIDAGNIRLGDICQARITIEVGALEVTLDSITDEHIDALNMCLNEALERATANDQKTSTIVSKTGHYDFHVLLAKCAGNQIYNYLINSMVAISIQFIDKYALKLGEEVKHVEEHQAILEAVKNKDKVSAKKLLVRHLLDTEDKLSKKIDELKLK